MKLSGGLLIAVAQATSQPCGPRLEMSGLSGSFADLNGLWIGCQPSKEKIFEIVILCSSDSVFSPESEYGFKKS